MKILIGLDGLKGMEVYFVLVCLRSLSDGLRVPTMITILNNDNIHTKNSTQISPNSTQILPNSTQIPPKSTQIPPNTTTNSTSTTVTADVRNVEDCIKTERNLDELNQHQFLDVLTKSCRYDKLAKPDSVNGKPLLVNVQIHVDHIELLDQERFKMNAFVHYRYVDARLNFERLSPGRSFLSGGDSMRNKIWVPHVVVGDEKDAKATGVFVSISAKGEISYAFKSSISSYCWMDFRKFPFDKQSCRLNFQTWSYNASQILLNWEKKDPVEFSPQLHLIGFALEGSWTSNLTVGLPITPGVFGGKYSALEFKFKVAREIGHYLRDYFIPSIMLVCTSWVTFWLRADASPPRATLGTATLLAFITLASLQTKPLPRVSYIKASEIWFLGCATFILASLVEFAFVNMIFRRRKQCELKKVNSKYIFKCTLTPSLARNELYKSMGPLSGDSTYSATNMENGLIKGANFDEPIESTRDGMAVIDVAADDNQKKPWTTMSPQDVANWIDTRCRVAFPVAFIIFNLFFWLYALGLTNN